MSIGASQSELTAGSQDLNVPAPTGTAALTPSGPQPSTAPLQPFQDVQARTDADKVALLSAIAQMGSDGKLAYNNQSAIQTAQKQQAIGGMLASQMGQMAPAAGIDQSLKDYSSALSSGVSTWFDNAKNALPVMEQRTRQQVNEYYQEQQLKRQQAAQEEQARQDEMKARAQAATQEQSLKNIELQIAQANLGSAQSREQTAVAKAQAGDNISAALKKLAITQNQGTISDLIDRKAAGMDNDPSMAGHGTKFRTYLLSIIANSKDFGQAMGRLDNASTGGALNDVVSYDVMRSWLDAWYNGGAPKNAGAYG